MSTEHVTVIGGGIAGLASAVLAAHQGKRVTLLERHPRLGGRAGLHHEAGFTFDTGPSWFLMPHVFDRFFATVGERMSDHLDILTLDPGYRVTNRGLNDSTPPTLTVDVPHSYPRVRALFESLEPGSGTTLDAYTRSAQATYQLAVDHFLYADSPLLTPDVLSRLHTLPSLLTSPMSTLINRTVTHPLLRQILGYPAVFLGTEPRVAPALYHLMSHLDLIDGVYYPQGGIYEIVRAFARMARDRGVTILTNTEAVSLSLDRHRIVGVGARGQHFDITHTDHVIAACDAHFVDSALLPQRVRTRSLRAWARRDPGIGAITVLLGVKGRIPQALHHNLFFTTDWDRNFDAIRSRQGDRARLAEPASAYVCVPSRTDTTVAPPGCENVFILIPAPADASLTAARVGTYVRRAVDSLGELMGVPDLSERALVRRVMGPGDFMTRFHAWHATALGPAHTLGQSAFLRYPVRAPRVDNLVYAGAFAPPGVGLPMCLISAHNAVGALR